MSQSFHGWSQEHFQRKLLALCLHRRQGIYAKPAASRKEALPKPLVWLHQGHVILVLFRFHATGSSHARFAALLVLCSKWLWLLRTRRQLGSPLKLKILRGSCNSPFSCLSIQFFAMLFPFPATMYKQIVLANAGARKGRERMPVSVWAMASGRSRAPWPRNA